MNEDDKEHREEGKKAFMDSPYDINQNPYSIFEDEEEMDKKRQWQYGWEDARREKRREDDDRDWGE